MSTPGNFDRLVIAARYWLLGAAEFDPAYHNVIEAMELCLDHHDGQRNGGQPEAVHQLGIFHWVRTQHAHLRNPALIYTLIFLHDILEDPNQASKKAGQPCYIAPDLIREKFGDEVLTKLLLLSKEVLGQKNMSYSLDAIFDDEVCSIVKGADRVDNVGSMVGVFKRDRLLRYVKETREEFLPRIKAARRKFSHQEASYEAMKYALNKLLSLIDILLPEIVLPESE